MIDPRAVKRTLEAALELIKDPARWTQGAFARHKQGNAIGPEEKAACRWCAIGALRRVTAGNDSAALNAMRVLDFEAKRAGAEDVGALNDKRSHAEVVEMFKRAIAACNEVIS